MPAKHDIIVIGASAGGVEALARLVEGLPANLAATIFIVLHIGPTKSNLPEILTNRGSLKASHAKDFEKIQRGHIYIAPPNHHLLLENGHMRIMCGPKENYHRPAIDCLFRSAAISYGPRVIGVVLSGSMNDDGIVGLLAVKKMKGIAIVQDPKEAVFSDMPRNALAKVKIDFCKKVPDISTLLVELSMTSTSLKMPKVPNMLDLENRMTKMEKTDLNRMKKFAAPSLFNCPECQGPLWEIQEGPFSRFRCHTGHAFSSKTLLVKLSETLEETLWTAQRAFKEKAELLKNNEVEAYAEDAATCFKHADTIMGILAGEKSTKSK